MNAPKSRGWSLGAAGFNASVQPLPALCPEDAVASGGADVPAEAEAQGAGFRVADQAAQGKCSLPAEAVGPVGGQGLDGEAEEVLLDPGVGADGGAAGA